MNGIPLVLLIVFSAFSMNLTLQCALGINSSSVNPKRLPAMVKLGIIFVSVILLWVIFARIISSIIAGVFIYVLIFPSSAVFYATLEFFIFKFVLKRNPENENAPGFPAGVTAAAAFICVNVANNFSSALALSFGFVFGIFLVFLILCEIQKRAALEAVPRFLRGKPLVLVSMGMLSLIFSTASLMVFRMIGN